MMTRTQPTSVLLTLTLLATSGEAHGLPTAPAAFCATYPDAPVCATSAPDCAFCHTVPPARNVFGELLAAALLPATPRPLDAAAFTAALGDALAGIEALDADGDGATNHEEILAGTRPGDVTSAPARGACPDAARSLGWSVCAPDLRYTHRKLMISFCGRSPTLTELDQLAQAADPERHLETVLDTCLDSEHWRGKDGVLWSLANRKIRPQRSVKVGDEGGDIPIADYFDDYNLFVYTQTDDRDARDLLLARYQVSRDDGPPTVYTPYTREPRDDIQARGFLGSQRVPLERRAGMITTSWFLMINTMFTGVPRTTAAQAYRAYLGYDLAKQEGLFAVAGEPVDYDRKGVEAPACAGCHAVLDPLAYPFAYYSGIGGESSQGLPGTYVAGRPALFTYVDGPRMTDLPEAGQLFGRPVRDLVEWAQAAANSPAFARATVLDYWRLLLGEDPSPAQQAQFDGLAAEFATTHAYRVERLLHALVKTEAYRVP
jgi:hypothetical protein